MDILGGMQCDQLSYLQKHPPSRQSRTCGAGSSPVSHLITGPGPRFVRVVCFHTLDFAGGGGYLVASAVPASGSSMREARRQDTIDNLHFIQVTHITYWQTFKLEGSIHQQSAYRPTPHLPLHSWMVKLFRSP